MRTTRMNPHLLYAQAIHGRITGRGIGIIDTVHLVEVARAIPVVVESSALSTADASAVREWFAALPDWMTTHQYGIDERDARNNHGTCWVMQVAAFAALHRPERLSDFCRKRYKTVLVPNQVAADGSFPEELRRTKPYGYSLFNLDAMATVCQILSTPDDNLWRYERRRPRHQEGGRVPVSLHRQQEGVAAQAGRDVPRPVADAASVAAVRGLALDEQKYLDVWKTLRPIQRSKR